MSTADKQIADTLAKFGEPMAGNIWRVQGQAVIYHKALERIAAGAKIAYDPPTLVRAERDEAVILVTGRMGDRVEWSIGEALIGVNYRVSGKQAAYVYAMAEKRAKDRVILKLIELHGLVYSEEEADEFKQSANEQRRNTSSPPDPEPQIRTSPEDRRPDRDNHMPLRDDDPPHDRETGEVFADPTAVALELKREIDKRKSIDAVTDYMLEAETQKVLQALPLSHRDEVRDHAKLKLESLGWPGRKRA